MTGGQCEPLIDVLGRNEPSRLLLARTYPSSVTNPPTLSPECRAITEPATLNLVPRYYQAAARPTPRFSVRISFHCPENSFDRDIGRRRRPRNKASILFTDCRLARRPKGESARLRRNFTSFRVLLPPRSPSVRRYLDERTPTFVRSDQRHDPNAPFSPLNPV